MTVIHCHGDKQFVILNQDLFLRCIYTHTKHWRKLECEKNLTWKKDLFYVEQPFRVNNNNTQKKKKKKVELPLKL